MDSKKGVILGKEKDEFILSDDSRHVFVYGPSGSGKGVSFVIPNLLFWEGSAIVHDIKRENFELTSGWREKAGSKIYLWNPACKNGESHCYNPLDWISDDPIQIIDDIQRIAHFILPEQEFWQNEARSLFIGILAWLVTAKNKQKTLGQVVRTIRSDDVVYNLAVILDTNENIHPVAYMNIASFLQKADKERSGVLSTLNSALELWANPVIDKLSSRSDFDFRKLRDENITIYVCVPADSIKRVRPLLHIFYDQLTSILCEKRCPEPVEPSVLMMMDDFVTLGPIESLDRGINYYRSYGIKFCCVAQSPSQINNIYAQEINSFFTNSSYRIAYAPNDVDTGSLINHLTHVTNEENGMRKLSDAEIYTLSKKKQILQSESEPAKVVDKLLYYKDKFFKEQLLPEASIPKQKIEVPKPKTPKERDAGILKSLAEKANIKLGLKEE